MAKCAGRELIATEWFAKCARPPESGAVTALGTCCLPSGQPAAARCDRFGGGQIGALESLREHSTRCQGTVSEAVEKSKNGVIPRSAATRNLSFCSAIAKEEFLTSFGMTPKRLFSAGSSTVPQRLHRQYGFSR